MAIGAGSQVTWFGHKAKVLGAVAGFTNIVKIELASGEVKEVNTSSLLEDTPADPRTVLPQDVQNALRTCEQVLQGPNGRVLANIISASGRGPDNSMTTAKEITMVLRTAAWGKGAPQLGATAPVRRFSTAEVAQKARGVAGSDHFHSHVTNALSQLRLLS